MNVCGRCHQAATGWTPLGRSHFDLPVSAVCVVCGDTALTVPCDCSEVVESQAAA